MIDIHSHIIPLADDGSESVDMSVNMLRAALKEGVNGIVATPHYIRGKYENYIYEIEAKIAELREAAKKENLDIDIYTGQEIMVHNSVIQLLKEKRLATLMGTRYVLVEFPMDIIERDSIDILYEIRILGLIPIVAHPERYRYIIEKPHYINRFIDEECLFQMNAGSFTGVFGKEVKKTAMTFLKSGMVNFVASDTHSDKLRKPGLEEALKVMESHEKGARAVVEKNLEKLKNDLTISSDMEKIKEKKSIFDMFRG